MYTNINFKTKKALKEAVAEGQQVTVSQSGPFPGTKDGKVYLEGPHYPQAHTWYAQATVKGGVIIKGTVK